MTNRMGYRMRGWRCSFISYTAVAALVVLLASVCAAQIKAASRNDMAWSQELNKYPGLIPEFGLLFEKLKTNVQFPPARHESNLLPLLPSSAGYYVAFPNYGDAAHQSLTIFQQELKENSVLRDWWQHGPVAKSGPELEGFIEKFYGLSQYLGNEVVISGGVGTKNSNFLVVAEVRKPGLKDFLQQMLKELPETSKPGIRILTPQELAHAKSGPMPQELMVLVRPDFVVAAANVETLQNFDHILETKSGGFSSTPFGQRVTTSYQDGTSFLGALDLQQIVSQAPSGTQPNQVMLEHSGFKDVKYLIWNRKNAGFTGVSEMELSFVGPRRGIASWLSAPAHLGSLDFVSPKAVMASSVVLKNPAEIYDDVMGLLTVSNPTAVVMLPAMEQMMHISLRNDLFGQLQGEITFELKDLVETQPAWAAILRVNDADRLQKTLEKVFPLAQVRALPSEEEGGITYHSVMIPSSPKPRPLTYAFADGYMIIASSRGLAAEAIRLHKSGESLAKSANYLASIPPGHSSDASGLMYEDPAAMTALQLKQFAPDMAGTLSTLSSSSTTTPIVFRVYGEESAIRGLSSGGGTDTTTTLIVAAIAIPNLLRAKIAANESSAVATLRTVNTAQVAYYSSYPQKGFARDLATLGPDPRGTGHASSAHASFIESALGAASCTSGKWCIKNGYQFSVTALCKLESCREFVVVGTPVSLNSGARSFCSTSDAVIRYSVGSPLTAPVSAAECKGWLPLR
ncbi:MAG: hypothetical protein ABSG70_13595 [Terriglobales bacterium]|jgi:hypothetical protein